MQDLVSKFRLDKRLQQRRGWAPADQLEREVNALPDVAEKAEVIDSPQHAVAEAPAPAEGDGE